jgi:FdhE protein
MSYVALAPLTGEARLAAGAARWSAIADRRPDLAAAAAVQARLVVVLVELLDQLQASPLPRLTLPPRYAAAKLARGVPALAGEPIPIPASTLKPGLERLGAVLAEGGAGEVAERICVIVRDGRVDAASLILASLARNQLAIRAGAQAYGVAPDLLWLIAELCASPYAHLLQRSLLDPHARDPHAPGQNREPLARALAHWGAGYCPACGSWPALAEIVGERRVLRCSFCALAWAPTAARCLYCGEADGAPALVTPDPAEPARGLEVCERCRGYLKTLPLDEPSPFPLVSIGDLETADLDLLAVERGYARPALREFAHHR